MHKYQTGFTLVELMIATAIVAIVLTVGVPSFQQIMQSNQLATQTNSFISSLNYARSESVKRRQNVVICPSATINNCNAGGNFENGWLVFVDVNRNGNFNSGDISLFLNNGLSNSSTLNSNVNRIVFNASGRPSANSSLILCLENDIQLARRIVVPQSGNIRLADKGPNGIPLMDINDPTSEISSC